MTSSIDYEKGPGKLVDTDDTKHHVVPASLHEEKLNRALSSRQISMIAIGGMAAIFELIEYAKRSPHSDRHDRDGLVSGHRKELSDRRTSLAGDMLRYSRRDRLPGDAMLGRNGNRIPSGRLLHDIRNAFHQCPFRIRDWLGLLV